MGRAYFNGTDFDSTKQETKATLICPLLASGRDHKGQVPSFRHYLLTTTLGRGTTRLFGVLSAILGSWGGLGFWLPRPMAGSIAATVHLQWALSLGKTAALRYATGL